jgi:hypothetical protein
VGVDSDGEGRGVKCEKVDQNLELELLSVLDLAIMQSFYMESAQVVQDGPSPRIRGAALEKY